MQEDNVRRGPERWRRAAMNAVNRPNSHGARLYRARLQVADELTRGHEALGVSVTRPFAVMKRIAQWHTPREDWEWRRDYAVCGTFCLAMQAQLECGGREGFGLDRIEKLMNGTDWSSVKGLDTTKLTRNLRCQCCGGQIKRG